MPLAPPKSVSETSSRLVSLVMGLVKTPTSKSGRYRRWIPIGWHPMPYQGVPDAAPNQERFLLHLSVMTRAGEEADVWAETGESVCEGSLLRPHMEVSMHVCYDPDALPRCLWSVAAALHQTSRHEIEHLLDEGFLALQGPTCKTERVTPMQEEWQGSVRLTHWYRIRAKLFARGDTTREMWESEERARDINSTKPKCKTIDYMLAAKEMHAFVKGFQAEAKFRKVCWDVPMIEYVDCMVRANKLTHEEADTVKSMMTKWAAHVSPFAPISSETLKRYL